MRYSKLLAISVVGITVVLGTGCAADAENAGTAQSEVTTTLSDAQIKDTLTATLKDVTFFSETDAPYEVIEGDGSGVSTITVKVVRERLAAQIESTWAGQLGLPLSELPDDTEDFSGWLEGARADANDEELDAEERAVHRKVADAFTLMQSQLIGVKGFAFGRDERSGDGSIAFVFVGRSKTTGRLIALTTFGAFT